MQNSLILKTCTLQQEENVQSIKTAGLARNSTDGTSVLGSQGYVQYWPGNLPLILAVPHGGSLRPDEIPDRRGRCYKNCRNVAKEEDSECTCSISTRKDLYTQEMASALSRELFALTNQTPHVIFNNLYRGKMDANRSLEEATLHEPHAVTAFHEYHDMLHSARAAVQRGWHAGLLIDLHGQAHKHEWVELGYCISADMLDSSAEQQLELHDIDSSIRSLHQRSHFSLEELVRGPLSLGGLLETCGVRVVPSPQYPGPDRSGEYYSGGYTTLTHGSSVKGQYESSTAQRSHLCTGCEDCEDLQKPAYCLANPERGLRSNSVNVNDQIHLCQKRFQTELQINVNNENSKQQLQHFVTEGNTVDAIQVEIPKSLRSKEQSDAFVKTLAQSLVLYLQLHYDLEL